MLPDSPFIIILGTAQDGGYSQSGCLKGCCKRVWEDSSLRRLTTSIAVINPETNEAWLIDATPDFKEQIHILNTLSPRGKSCKLSGIFLTHGHIGHYTGLIYLGLEVMNTNDINVYAMPKMLEFLNNNAPWNQLILNKNIRLNPLSENSPVTLTTKISLSPIIVPHRGELTETVGYKIEGPNKTILFIPDIDYWDKKTLGLINNVDIAIVDGTFFDKNEVPERNIGETPHPLIIESMKLFKELPREHKEKIFFIHFNHTNPVLLAKSIESKTVSDGGFCIAQEEQIIGL